MQTSVRRLKKNKALKEIVTEQNKTNNIIPTAPMRRVVSSMLPTGVRITKGAFEALCTDAEHQAVELFAKANACAIHAGRQTVSVEDFNLARYMDQIPSNPTILQRVERAEEEPDQSPSLM